MCVTYDSYYGVFDYIDVGQSDACYGNALKDSAIARSSGGGDTLHYYDGRLAVSGINVTDNYCKYYSGIYCYPNVINASISFSAFSNNTSGYCICLVFYNDNLQYNEMHACNVIDNKQMDYSTYGTIRCYSYLTITDSYINNNVAQRDFYCVSGGSITIKNSVINTSKTTSGTVSCIQCNASGVRIDLDFEDDCYLWMIQQFSSFSTMRPTVRLRQIRLY